MNTDNNEVANRDIDPYEDPNPPNVPQPVSIEPPIPRTSDSEQKEEEEKEIVEFDSKSEVSTVDMEYDDPENEFVEDITIVDRIKNNPVVSIGGLLLLILIIFGIIKLMKKKKKPQMGKQMRPPMRPPMG